MIESARVSVVIPAHNGATYLAATLQSVADQTARPGEVIVVDDGSTDATVEIARSFGVTVISQSKSGPAAARNAGTRAASGDFIAYLDADDLWAPDKLAVQVAALRSYAQPVFSFTDFRYFDDRGAIAKHPGLAGHPAFRRTAGRTRGRELVYIAAGDEPVLPDNYILPSSLVARRADVLGLGGFDESIRIGIEDYEFLLRLYRIAPAVAVMRPLLLYRRHPLQLSSKAVAMKTAIFEILERIEAAPHRYPPADVRHLHDSMFLHHYRIGIEQARTGDFDAAAERFARSWAARPKLRTALALGASRAGNAPAGRAVFGAVRTLWKSRPKRG